MNLLLDTHAFLWWITDSPDLSARAREVIESPENIIHVSAVCAWEVAIKARIGKISLQATPERLIPEMITLHRFTPLSIQMIHALRVFALPDYHRDPFDRLLVAQAQVEDLAIISRDPLLRPYGVTLIW